MTESRRLELEEKLNMAEAKGNEAEIAAVKKTMEQEYRICTSHTADRLKRVEDTVNAIKEGLIPANMFEEMQKGLQKVSSCVEDLREEIEGWKQRAKGAALMWKILGYLAAAGGGGIIIKLLTYANDATQAVQ